MALIKCPECEKEISDRASACPHCGFPISSETNTKKEKTDNIKFVPAKCPSCGANIEVNENEKKTKCKYCETTIIVDEAIQKLQIEISGEVEVKNLPKLEGLIKVADRHYENAEFDEAYKLYSNALNMDPNNTKLIFRKGVCKVFVSKDDNLDTTVNTLTSFVESMKEKNDNESRTNYVEELINVLLKYDDNIHNKFKKIEVITHEDIDAYLSKLIECSEMLEKSLIYFEDDESKQKVYKRIVDNCSEILKDWIYRIPGSRAPRLYIIDKSMEEKVKSKRQKYLALLYKISGDSNIKDMLNQRKMSPLIPLAIVASFIFGPFARYVIVETRYSCLQPSPYVGFLSIIAMLLIIVNAIILSLSIIKPKVIRVENYKVPIIIFESVVLLLSILWLASLFSC